MFLSKFTPSAIATALSACWFVVSPIGYHSSVINIPQDVFMRFFNQSYTDRYGSSFDSNRLPSIWAFTVSVFGVGLIFGNLASTVLVDKLGRKTCLFVVANLFYALASLFMGLSKIAAAPEMIMFGRFILGIGGGIAASAYSIYFSESTPVLVRGFFGTLESQSLEVGATVGFILALPQICGNDRLWPLLLAFNGIFSILHIVQWFLVPESPRHLHNKIKIANESTLNNNELKRSIRFFHGKDVNTEGVIAEIAESSDTSEVEEGKPSLKEFFSNARYYKPLFIGMAAIIAPVTAGFYIIIAYSTTILNRFNVPLDTAKYISLSMSIVNLCSALTAPFTIHRFKRRIMYLGGLTVLLIANIGIFIFGLISQYNPQLTWPGYVVAACMVLIFAVWTQGPGSIPLFLPSEMSQQSVRPITVSLTLMTHGIVIMLSQLIFFPLFDKIGAYCFLICIVMVTILLGVLIKILPETKHKTIAEITDYWDNS